MQHWMYPVRILTLIYIPEIAWGCYSCASLVSSHAGVEPMSQDEEEVLESDDDESGQENVTPNDDGVARAVAEEEAMMEMTEDGPYRAIF